MRDVAGAYLATAAEAIVESAHQLAARTGMTTDEAHRRLLLTLDLFEAQRKLHAIKALVADAREISSGPGMVVYVADVEAVLGRVVKRRPHKLGQNGDRPMVDVELPAMP